MKKSAKSIRARLLNISKNENLSFQLIVIRYFQERLLFRLSQSRHKDTFCLKGGVLLYLFEEHKSRPTMDIDFLASNTRNETENLKAIFKDICKIDYEDDAVTFDFEEIETSEITKQGNYNGIRVKVTGKLDTIKQNIQIDIGFGDKVYPNPILVKYPVILEMEEPEINVYSIYSAIAEKFEAMIQLSEANSRMKDFYDIYTLLKNNDIDKQKLEKAINLTFETRKTIISGNHSLFENTFHEDKNRITQWKAFLRKAKITDDIKFETVMQIIEMELKPIYERMKK
ncbi:MAG: nucleotidyl transferase AbiEii/AbiGii toxin family protein [Bacteroidales bacterium]|nr:nucleotidyl transferase AbiEii/AbiGii toxin family protein [Bacteroidales bacterium]